MTGYAEEHVIWRVVEAQLLYLKLRERGVRSRSDPT